jgi:hypothetical protein
LTSLFIFSLIKSPGLANHRLGAISLINFEAHKPFQYRVLLPCIIRAIDFITPGIIKSEVRRALGSRLFARERALYPSLPESLALKIERHSYRVVIYLMLNFAALFSYLLMLRYLARALHIFSADIADLLPAGMAFIMPIFFDYSNLMYDFTHLFLFTAGLLLLYRGKWLFYIVVLTLAILNKETAIMLTVIYFIYYFKRLPRAEFLQLLGFQLAIFIIIKLSLYFIFLDNPGGVVEWHWRRNLKYIFSVGNYFKFTEIGRGMLWPFYLNIPIPHGLNLLVFGPAILAIIYKWKTKPLFLRQATAYIIIVVALALPAGIIGELRAYYDVLPIAYLLAMSGLTKLYEAINLRIETRRTS